MALPFPHATAQLNENKPQHLMLQGRMIDGQAVVKIIPGDPATWFYGMKNGYEVSIAEFKDDAYTDYRVLEPQLMPASEAEFRATDAPEKYAEPMRKIIYEETFAPKSQAFEDRAAASEDMNRMHFGFLLFSAYHPATSRMSGLQLELPNDIADMFKLKVRVNGTEIEHEQNMLLRAFHSTLHSPILNVKKGDRKVNLAWNHSDYQMQFVAYRPERSVDGGDFRPIGTPIIFNANSKAGKLGMISIEDSVSANYRNYRYRLAGYDAFGILSEYSPPVQVTPTDLTPPPAPDRVDVREGDEPGEVLIAWQAPATPDLQGFQVVASPSEQGEYRLLHSELLPPSTSEFKFTFDTKPLLYYRVLAVDTAGNASASNLGYLVVYDTIPPVLPKNISTHTDTNYVVTISWEPSPSPDVKGYRLFKAFSPTHGFVPVTSQVITGTSFADSLRDDRLEKKVFYRLVALDHHYNHSERSPLVAAAIPDRIPPTSPLLMRAELDAQNGVSLAWRKSASPDVETQTIYRRTAEDSTYAFVATLSLTDSVHTDKSIRREGAAKYAEYYVTATDSSGNESARSNGKRVLFDVSREVFEVDLRSAVAEDDHIRLDWTYSDAPHSILIYRAVNADDFRLIGRVEQANSYLDRAVNEGNTYHYKVGALEAGGHRSPISKTISVEVE